MGTDAVNMNREVLWYLLHASFAVRRCRLLLFSISSFAVFNPLHSLHLQVNGERSLDLASSTLTICVRAQTHTHTHAHTHTHMHMHTHTLSLSLSLWLLPARCLFTPVLHVYHCSCSRTHGPVRIESASRFRLHLIPPSCRRPGNARCIPFQLVCT